MNYQETLRYLYEQLPMFQRIGPAAYKADLNNTIALCKILGNPQKKFRSIHVAGTNGKGSSSHMLAAILQENGYNTGLYTSPHLIDFRERIRINGKMITQKKVQLFVRKYQQQFDKIKPSFFEWTVALAFDYFAEEKVDIAVIEVGLGGRLDSTNIIRPIVSLITNIGFDHMDFLGDTLEKIANEKAGIIKQKVPVVISQRQNETEQVFLMKAKKENAAISFASDELIPFSYQYSGLTSDFSVLNKSRAEFEQFELDLPGVYQQKNLCGVLKVVEILRRKKFTLHQDKVKRALKKVRRLTGLRGRFELLNEQPSIIADTGHNAEGISEVIPFLLELKKRKLHFIIGVVGDKDPSRVLKLLPKEKTKYYFTKADLPRSLSEKKLQQVAQSYGLKGTKYPSVSSAYEKAIQQVDKNDIIFIGGSTFVVADFLKYWREK